MHVLSLALLFAQLGMVVHASTHLRADAHGTPTQGQLCGECLSFAPMQNMAGGVSTLVLPVHLSHVRAVERVARSSIPNHEFSAFRSRAPPVPS